MFNHYGVDTQNDSISEYFSPFIFDEWFNYQGFIQKVISLHVPDSINDKLISYYSVMNEICNLLLHNQNQSFHDFKNRMSNYLFNMEQLNVFQFNTIDDFFKSYENSKDDHIKYNTKRISPALLYQYLFRQNNFAQMYQFYKQIGKVDDSNDEIIRKLYPQRSLLDNFNEFLEYNRHIYQFLSIQEKISIIQTSMPSETSLTYTSPPSKSKTNLQRQNTVSKLKLIKGQGSKFQSQNSNFSNKSSSPNQQVNRKSQFQNKASMLMSKQGTMLIQQDSIQLDRSESKESIASIATPASAGKKSIFSGI